MDEFILNNLFYRRFVDVYPMPLDYAYTEMLFQEYLALFLKHWKIFSYSMPPSISVRIENNAISVRWTGLKGNKLSLVNNNIGKKFTIRETIVNDTHGFNVNLSQFQHQYKIPNGIYYLEATNGNTTVASSPLMTIDGGLNLSTVLANGNNAGGNVIVNVGNLSASSESPFIISNVGKVDDTGSTMYGGLTIDSLSSNLTLSGNTISMGAPVIQVSKPLTANYTSLEISGESQVGYRTDRNITYVDTTGVITTVKKVLYTFTLPSAGVWDVNCLTSVTLSRQETNPTYITLYLSTSSLDYDYDFASYSIPPTNSSVLSNVGLKAVITATSADFKVCIQGVVDIYGGNANWSVPRAKICRLA